MAKRLVGVSGDLKMAEQMSNEELSRAISEAYNRAGDASDIQRDWRNHMNALMEVQLDRALAISVSAESIDCFDGQQTKGTL